MYSVKIQAESDQSSSPWFQMFGDSLKANPQHYRWLIVLAGVFGVFASIGIGRFSLGMLLPSMGESLALSYSQMGTISTLNFCGYLGAALICGKLSRIVGARALIAGALLLVGASMILIGVSNHLWLIIVLYFLTGVGSGMANVPIMALMATWFEPKLRGRASGTIVTGNGIGIIMAGHLIPVLNATALGWRLSWHILGLMVIVAAAVCWLLIRNRPQKRSSQAPDDYRASVSQQRPSLREENRLGDSVFVLCGAIYFLFGFTYVIFVTFFVTSLVQERHLSEIEAGVLWSWVGLLSLVSGPFFGYLSDRFSRKFSLIIVFTIQALAYVSAIAYLPEIFLYVSILCFGIVAWSVPTIMVALIGDLAGPERTTAIFGFVTFIFGIGQISGPYCAGLMAEISGGFATSFMLAAVLALGAAVMSTQLPGVGGKKRVGLHEKDISTD